MSMAKEKVTNKEPKYKVGEKGLRLNNRWAKQFEEDDGLRSEIVGIKHDKDGTPLYTLKVFRPIKLAAREEDLIKD
jgi:hypothetical protein